MVTTSRSTQSGCDFADSANLLDAPLGARCRAQAAARRAYALFRERPDHPSLRFKKLGGYADVWSVRINEQHRAVGRRSGDAVVWFWIGSHNAFDKMF